MHVLRALRQAIRRTSLRLGAAAGGALCLLLVACAAPFPATAQAGSNAPLRFGIMPSGGPLEARNEWEPLLAGLARDVGRPVYALSVTSFDALDTAIRRNEVDIAFLSGQMALDAVLQQDMVVVAEARHDNRAVLVTRKNAIPATLEDMLAMPGRLRLAHGEPQSLSGYLVPQLRLFLPNRLRLESFFASETIGTHQYSALSVANGEADVGTSSTADLERFKARFPQEFERLKIVWKSEPLPRSQIVVRRTLSPEIRERIRHYLASYGHTGGPRGEAERAALRRLHDFSDFVAAENTSLLPSARLVFQLARQSALNAQWVSEAARQIRLQRIDSDYAYQLAALGHGRGASLPMLVHAAR